MIYHPPLVGKEGDGDGVGDGEGDGEGVPGVSGTIGFILNNSKLLPVLALLPALLLFPNLVYPS